MRLLLLSVVCVLAGCWGNKPDPRVGPIYEPVDPADARWEKACGEADANLTKLGCREAKLKNGRTFKEFCVEKMNMDEGAIPLAPRCLSKITDCKEVDTTCNP